MTIVEFIEAAIQDDESIARAVTPDDWGVVDDSPEYYEWQDIPDRAHRHARLHGPDRVLAEVTAKRTIIADRFRHFETIDGEWGCCHGADAIRAGECPDNRPDVLDVDSTLRALARIYSDRPEFESRWLEDA